MARLKRRGKPIALALAQAGAQVLTHGSHDDDHLKAALAGSHIKMSTLMGYLSTLTILSRLQMIDF